MQPAAHHKTNSNTFHIQTKKESWIIPHDCELLKALLKHQKLHAADFQFESNTECQNFIKQLFLMALEDETRNQMPSKLASLGRDLINIYRS